MNKERRERLECVNTTVDEAMEQIQEVIDDEQEAFDGLPESLQGSELGSGMIDAIGDMEWLIDKLNSFENDLGDVVQKYSPRKRKVINLLK